MILELFGGPGGWAEGLRLLGGGHRSVALEPVCIEDAAHPGALVQVPDERCAQLVAELLQHTVTLNSIAHVMPKVVTP